MAADAFCLPDDVLVQILLLLAPVSSRRPLRLVCKGWRDLIDERAPPPPPQAKLPPKILIFINRGRSATALVFDDKSSRHKHKWTYTSSSEDEGSSSVHMVGTCNGLLCLHDHTSYGGITFSAVTVTNPVTGETAALPPVPARWAWSQLVKAPGKYSFGFHPETKRHKVVYIPRGQYRSADDALQVFTLGGGGGDTAAAAWRAVPVRTPGACYDLLCDPITAGGCTYWIAASAGEVMALDLKDERVASFAVPPAMGPVPAMSAPRYWREVKWRLTKVADARIGVVVSSSAAADTLDTRVEVWVLLDGGGGEEEKPPQWSRRYSVVEGWSSWVMVPQLTHGDCILRASEDGRWEWDGDFSYCWGLRKRLYRHEVGDLTDGEIERRRTPKEAELIISDEERKPKCKQLTTFAYVETLNPVARIK